MYVIDVYIDVIFDCDTLRLNMLILTAKEIGDGVVARTLCGTSEYMVRPMVWYLLYLLSTSLFFSGS